MLAYLLLLVAIVVEVASTSLLPSTHGFTAPLPSAAVIVGYAVSVVLLAVVVKHIPVGITYAIWSGVGTLAVVVIGATLLHQHISVPQVAGVLLIVGGVVLVNLGGATH